MPPIINAQGISKQFGPAPLFKDIAFTVSEGDRIGLIGPNGSGKSTLLAILAWQMAVDSGEVSIRRHARLSLVGQVSEFAPGQTVGSIAGNSPEILGRAGFTDLDAEAASLSGGWRKRLAIVEGLVRAPDILLLDEPTNHLDLAGIKWLETVLQNPSFACVIVSHDRYLLENVATEVVELHRAYSNGLLRVKGTYTSFLEAKEAYLHAQEKHQDALENRVHAEIEWLRRGAKARRSKSKAQIGKAQDLIGELANLSSRTRTSTASIEFSATDRRTKQLIELDHVGYAIGGRTLLENLDFTVKSGSRLGLVGPNGSGKTTLLRLLLGEIQPTRGEIRRAEHLRMVYFDQTRALDPEVTLRRSLAPDSDAVVYQDRLIHVASWAARFLFSADDLDRPVGKLSGGERARVLIAQLMLQAADVLLLDEPTNDLDIPTLEVLEESLLEYRGALVLVTHDRYMMDRVSTVVLGLDGYGNIERFADYSQWDEWQVRQRPEPARPAAPRPQRAPGSKKKMSYLDAREYATIEQRIADAEAQVQAKRAALEDPAIMSDGPALQAAATELEAAQKAVDDLYARWAELEET